MPTAQVLTTRPHSVGRFRLAAWARFREADQLALAAFRLNNPALRLGAIYLYGYVAELVLKSAYFRCRSANANGTFSIGDLNNARNRATQHFHINWHGNLHSLQGWSSLLIHERAAAGQPYTAQFSAALTTHVSTLMLLWRESIRYYYSRPRLSESSRAHAAARWLLASLPRL